MFICVKTIIQGNISPSHSSNNNNNNNMKLYAHLFVFAILTSATFCTEPTNTRLCGGRQTQSVIGPVKAFVSKTVGVRDRYAYGQILKDTGVSEDCDTSDPSKFAIDYTNKVEKNSAKLYEAINIAAAFRKPAIAAALAKSLVNLLPDSKMSTKMRFLKTLLEEKRFEVFRFVLPVVYEGFNKLSIGKKYEECSVMVRMVLPYLMEAINGQDYPSFKSIIKGMNAAFGQIAYFSLGMEGKSFFQWVFEEGIHHPEATSKMLIKISKEFVVAYKTDFKNVVSMAGNYKNVSDSYRKAFETMNAIIFQKDAEYTKSGGYRRDGYWQGQF